MTDKPDWANEIVEMWWAQEHERTETGFIQFRQEQAAALRKVSRKAKADGFREAAEIAGEYENLWSMPTHERSPSIRSNAGMEIKAAICAAAAKLEKGT